MATSSEVKAGLDEIALVIKTARSRLSAAKAQVSSQNSTIDGLPVTYADLIATINAYGTADAFEALSKAELAKLITEFMALNADVDLAVADLANRTEF